MTPAHTRTAPFVRTIGFPRRYCQGPHAIRQLAPLLRAAGSKSAALVVDPVVADLLRPTLAESFGAEGLAPFLFDAPPECTSPAIDALAERVAESGAEAIVGFGGGKAIDVSKGAASRLGLPLTICPTVASSDAPTSRLIVLYDEQHTVAGVEFMGCNPDLVLVDTDIIVRAPPRLFAAGIGDALSKRFEARQCLASGGLNSFGTFPLSTAILLADSAYAVIRSDATQAYRDVRNQQVTPAVERLVEATVLLSGLGFESGGLSVAHALIRGLTTLPNVASRLHGELVAYGTLVQLCWEQQPPECVAEVLAIIRAVDLPDSLAALGQAAPLTQAERQRVATATLANSYAANTAPPLTAEALLAAMDEVERLAGAAPARAVA